MISVSTFWITSIVVLILATLIVTIICIKTDKDKLSIGINLLGAYILIALVMTIMLTPIESYYIDGRVILNIENIEYNNSSKSYTVTEKSGKEYKIKDTLSSDKNFVSLKCKYVNKNILGIEIYDQRDILFVNVADENMSESEKTHALDRLAPKY